MILVIDVGNTNITLGVFEGEEIKATFRMTSGQKRTSDEYGIYLCSMLEHRGIDPKGVSHVVISSVVPDVMYSLNSGVIKYFNLHPLVIKPGTKTGIRLVTGNPKEIGADRIVDAMAAYTLYGGPVLVIDFGTATTYDLILEDGSFVAGITSPGIRISAKALWEDTAKLPAIEIRKPKSILAKDTITSMQAGLVYGYIGQTEYIIRKVKEESGLGDELHVVATGGLGKIIADEVDAIQVYDNMLTLKGLRLIYEKNQ
ncbi:MAG: type III pantothenate kinase [Lachnospiraceae bacterium]|nr:type III pantothenate kinase [Lachnospiraceae bacterium]MCI9100216.1 type III pantothenate kinase [Lachnospiraceae bacterium]MCI9358190.1 type III pantothenate kinase [Lachnospiraceae bacterium]